MCMMTASQSNAAKYLGDSSRSLQQEDQSWLDRFVKGGPQEVYSPDMQALQDLVAQNSELLGRRTDTLEKTLTPDVYNARKQLASQVSDDLAGGGQLPADIQHEAMKAGLIKALGSGTDPGSSGAGAATVANVLGRAVINRRDQNQAKAAAFLNDNARPMAGLDPGSIAGIKLGVGQNYATSRNMFKGGVQQGESDANDRSAQRWGQALAAAAQESANNASAKNAAAAANLKFQSDMAAAAAGAAGGAAKCWVARAVYGPENPKWLLFRNWIDTKAPRWFYALYLKFGERLAAWIQDKPTIKHFIRLWMDKRIAA